ncbi:dystrotelin [Lepisosteus oculatus]|uniref:dystrotelin n=1 Tax=Lepisosteus oculatus TaxID=7918 RepID=UPI0035F522E5
MDPDKIEGLNEIQHSVYRTAFKLRSLQTQCQLDLVDLELVKPMLYGLRTTLQVDGRVSLRGVTQSLQKLFHRTGQEKPGQVAAGATEHTARLLTTLYDKDHTGFIPLRSMVTALVVFSGEKLSAKYTALSELAVQCSVSQSVPSGHVTRSGLRILLEDLKQIPGVAHESNVFGSVESAVRSCFQGVLTAWIPEGKFVEWLQSDPKFLLWLSTLYRISASEAVTHHSRCDICKSFPMCGLRYRCLKCLNLQICQVCFLTCKTTKKHKESHPVMEHCTQPSLKETLKVFTRTARNNLLPRRCRQKEAHRREALCVVESGAPSPDIQPPDHVQAQTDPKHSSPSHVSHCIEEVKLKHKGIIKKELKTTQTDTKKLPESNHQPTGSQQHQKKVTAYLKDQLNRTQAAVRSLQRDKCYLEHQVLLWKGTSQSEHTSLKDMCGQLEAKMEVLAEHNQNLQEELARVYQTMQLNQKFPQSIVSAASLPYTLRKKVKNAQAVNSQHLKLLEEVKGKLGKNSDKVEPSPETEEPAQRQFPITLLDKRERTTGDSSATGAAVRITECLGESDSRSHLRQNPPDVHNEDKMAASVQEEKFLPDAADEKGPSPTDSAKLGEDHNRDEDDLFELVQQLKKALSLKVQTGSHSATKQELIEAAECVGDAMSHLVGKVSYKLT